MGTNLFIILFISKFMKPENLGEYSIAFFFFQMFIVISYFGMEVYIGKEVSLKKNDSNGLEKIFSELLSTFFYGILLAFLVMGIFALFYEKIGFMLILLSFIAGILFGLERNLGAFLLGKEKVHIDSIYNIISFIITISLVLILKKELSIILIFIIRSFSLLIGISGRLVYIVKDLSNIKFNFVIKNFKEISFFWFMAILVFFERQIDIFILSFFVGKELLGSYYLALRIFFTVNLFIEVISHSLTPFISRSFKGKETILFRNFLNKIFITILFAGLFFGSFLYIFKDLLVSIFNKEFILECSPYLAVLALAVPFKVGRNMLGSVMSSSKFQYVRFKINLFSTIIFIVSLPFFIYTFFTIGAIISRLIIEIIIFSLYFYFVFFIIRKKYDSGETALND